MGISGVSFCCILLRVVFVVCFKGDSVIGLVARLARRGRLKSQGVKEKVILFILVAQ